MRRGSWSLYWVATRHDSGGARAHGGPARRPLCWCMCCSCFSAVPDGIWAGVWSGMLCPV